MRQCAFLLAGLLGARRAFAQFKIPSLGQVEHAINAVHDDVVDMGGAAGEAGMHALRTDQEEHVADEIKRVAGAHAGRAPREVADQARVAAAALRGATPGEVGAALTREVGGAAAKGVAPAIKGGGAEAPQDAAREGAVQAIHSGFRAASRPEGAGSGGAEQAKQLLGGISPKEVAGAVASNLRGAAGALRGGGGAKSTPGAAGGSGNFDATVKEAGATLAKNASDAAAALRVAAMKGAAAAIQSGDATLESLSTGAGKRGAAQAKKLLAARTPEKLVDVIAASNLRGVAGALRGAGAERAGEAAEDAAREGRGAVHPTSTKEADAGEGASTRSAPRPVQRWPVALFLALAPGLAFGAYAVRHYCYARPRPVGLPALEAEGRDTHPLIHH